LLTVVDELLCTKSALPPPPTVTDIDCPGVVVKLELLTTAPPPPPCGHQTPARPAPPLLPPPTTNTRTNETPVGTVQLQLPTVENVRTVSPFEAVVEVEVQFGNGAGYRTMTTPDPPALAVATVAVGCDPPPPLFAIGKVPLLPPPEDALPEV